MNKKEKTYRLIAENFKKILYESNAETKYGTEVLEKNNIELGDIIKNREDLKKGNIYCIVNFGENRWQPALELINIKAKGPTEVIYTFESTLQWDDYKIEFTGNEIEDYIKNNAIAFQVY